MDNSNQGEDEVSLKFLYFELILRVVFINFNHEKNTGNVTKVMHDSHFSKSQKFLLDNLSINFFLERIFQCQLQFDCPKNQCGLFY